MKIFLFIFLFTISGAAQAPDKITARCPSPNQSTFASVLINNEGDIVANPCFGRSVIFPSGIDLNFTQGSIPFADVNGVLVQNNPRLFFDNTNTTLKLVDSSYVPILGAKTFLSIGSTTPIVNSGHFLGTIYDLILTQSGSGHDIEGTYLNLSVGGNHTNDFMTGVFIGLDNRLDTGATNHLAALNIFNNIERTANEGYGIDVFSALGGSGATGTGKVIGIRSLVGLGHGASTPLGIAGWFEINTQGNGAGVADLTKLARFVYTNQATETITEARGLSFDGWTNAGTVTNSSVIYFDNSVDGFGGTTNYIINSQAVSSSIMLGDFAIMSNTKGIILRSPDNTCHRLAVSNANALSASTVTCP